MDQIIVVQLVQMVPSHADAGTKGGIGDQGLRQIGDALKSLVMLIGGHRQ